MTSPFTSLACLTTLGCLFAGTVLADGVDKMFDYRENYIDELEIIGDVTFPDGDTAVMFEMAKMQMRFYVPEDAAYVTIDANNPVFSGNMPFYGGWVSTAPANEEQRPDCAGPPRTNHDGQLSYVYGDVVWRYTGLENGDYYYELKIGECDGPVQEWAFNDPAKNPLPLSEAREACGNASDLVLRALACSDVIANPDAQPADVSWALWSRAYVRCGDAPMADIMADLMAAVRIDPSDWQDYYRRVSGYNGPMDGRMNYQLHGAVSRFAFGGCR